MTKLHSPVEAEERSEGSANFGSNQCAQLVKRVVMTLKWHVKMHVLKE